MAISLNPSVCLGDQLEVGNLLVIARAQARGLGLRLKCMEKCLKVCSVMNLRPHLLCNCNRHQFSSLKKNWLPLKPTSNRLLDGTHYHSANSYV